ncbi:MAG: beta-ribofuranosylaminobenzene 5'-phosphate synthase [Candidatus Bathyarchaeota archaeon]|nr:beta-ribofuranosylaminobenzene 5'-phosphate synthase [Candidatus Bathyarchaeota archaeon]
MFMENLDKCNFKVVVKTPSRLHFTLIDLNGEVGRVDGGIGVALNYPGVRVEATRTSCAEVKVKGFRKNLALKFVKTFLTYYTLKPSVSIKIVEDIPEHVGLGSGTQLALAIAKCLAEVYGVVADVRRFAEIMGRGGTSGIGVAAFEGGGFILDGGHSFGKGKQKESFLPSHFSKTSPAPLLVRYPLPEDWFFVVCIPKVNRKFFGLHEFKIFRKYCPVPAEEVCKLTRIILMKILPSIVERNIEDLGLALTEIQSIGFKKIEVQLQHKVVKELIKWMLENEACGAGLSSFGPAVYGLVKGERKAERLVKKVENFLIERKVENKVFYTNTNNIGAEVFRVKLST